jgi:4-hydroxybenzoate polyprenyltransferase
VNIHKSAKAYIGFSRMSHAILDVGYPALGAILVLGSFPSYPLILLGLAAASAGYIAVFALNDLMDLKVDTERIEGCQRDLMHFDIDVLGMRHPVAQKALPFRHGLVWVSAWGMLSLFFAYILNPVCILILMVAVVLEIGYCRLLRVTHWKTILSGSMVGIGTLAGPYAVVRNPPWTLLLFLFLWAFLWEVGARNIPNDWADLEEDVHLGIKTFPVRYGRSASSGISFGLVCLTAFVGLLVPLVVSLPNTIVYEAGAAVTGALLLIRPGWRWVRDNSVGSALGLFNRACFYPLVMLFVAGLAVLTGR